jgi:aspartate aminotransferase
VRIAGRISSIKPSATIAVSTQARTLKAAGRDIINLGAGEPDFDTPDHVKNAAKHAIDTGDTKYTSVDGTAALKRAVVEKFRRDNGLGFAADHISIGSGASQVIFNALFATVEPADEVIIPAPYWVSYPDMVLLAGGTPVIAPCRFNDGFKLAPKKLASLLTERTRWLIINSPNNPTGAIYSKQDLQDLARVLADYPKVSVISDELYEHLNYEAPSFVSFASAANGFNDKVLTVNGVSKSYAMTGWRIGFGAGPKKLIEAMAVVQSKCTTNPSSISQAAAVEALIGPQDFIAKMKEAFSVRRKLIASKLNAIEGAECRLLGGGLSVLANFSGLIGKRNPMDLSAIDDDQALTRYFLDSVGVAVVPGTAFGAPGFVRIALGCPNDVLEEACTRLQQACKDLLWNPPSSNGG